MSTSMPGLQGRWNRVKGDIQRKWGQITDDDLRSRGECRSACRPDPGANGRDPRRDQKLSGSPGRPEWFGCIRGRGITGLPCARAVRQRPGSLWRGLATGT